MKAQIIILGLILSLVLIAGCAKQQIIGGQRDEHGCLGPAGYSWNASIGACVREWELDEGQRKAAQIVIAPLSYPVTITEVEVLRCLGCFVVHLQRNDNQKQFQVDLINWTIKPEPLACTEEAKICPDGTAVGRDSENNCEFKPCPREKHVCIAAEKAAEICTMEYMPVCGWFNESIECFKYPCAATYGNGCQACADAKVAYWTSGECPE
jgi:hypothetical protein